MTITSDSPARPIDRWRARRVSAMWRRFDSLSFGQQFAVLMVSIAIEAMFWAGIIWRMG